MNTIKEITKLSSGKDLDIEYPIRLYNKEGQQVYFEDSDCHWRKSDYKDGNEVYHEDSYGYWWKCDYDSNGNETYYENSFSYWYKCEHEEGNEVYFEDSSGYIDDCREPVDLTMEEVCKLAGRKVRIVE